MKKKENYDAFDISTNIHYDAQQKETKHKMIKI